MPAKIGFGPLKGPDRFGVSASGLTLAYAENAAVVNVTPINTTTMQLGLVTDTVSNGKAGIELQGTAAGACSLRIEVMHNGNVATSFLHHLAAGDFTLGIPFILRNIPAESGNWALRFRTDTSSISLPLRGSSWWIESGAIEGGLIASDPSSFITEPVAYEPNNVVDLVTTALQVPVERDAAEAVDTSSVLTVVDVATVTFGGSIVPAASADDGYASASVFNTGSTVVRVGNSAGDVRGAFIRWTLPVDLHGRTMVSAVVTLVPDATQISPVQIKMTADVNPLSAQIVSEADRLSRTVTTAFIATSLSPSAGSAVTYNVKSLFDEILAGGPASFLEFQLFLDDNGSATDVEAAFRSVDYGTPTQRPKLDVTYL